MRIDVITLFPELVLCVGHYGIPARCIERKLLSLHAHNPRDYSDNSQRRVDDRAYGGGPGMLMQFAPLQGAIRHARSQQPGAAVLYLSPQGERLDQPMARQLAQSDGLILLAGRYEGVDERLIEREVDREISLGDYVLSGGELAAMVLVDAIARLQPGALGHEQSAQQDSFSDGLLDCPHYTRPREVDGQAVPAVLLSGDHAAIARWRREQALLRTARRRPDLLPQADLSDSEWALLSAHGAT